MQNYTPINNAVRLQDPYSGDRVYVSAEVDDASLGVVNEGERMYVSTINTAGSSCTSTATTSIPSTTATAKRGFLASLLSRSASMSGRHVVHGEGASSYNGSTVSHSSNYNGSTVSHSSSSMLPSSSSMPAINHAVNHSRHSSNPPTLHSSSSPISHSQSLSTSTSSLGLSESTTHGHRHGLGIGVTNAPRPIDGVFSHDGGVSSSPQSGGMRPSTSRTSSSSWWSPRQLGMSGSGVSGSGMSGSGVSGSPRQSGINETESSAPLAYTSSSASASTTSYSTSATSSPVVQRQNSSRLYRTDSLSSPGIQRQDSSRLHRTVTPSSPGIQRQDSSRLHRTVTPSTSSTSRNVSTPSTPTHASHKGKQSAREAIETAPDLPTLGLELLQMTPNMALSRYGVPLCGAVLDDKFLLIGTTTGLDFLPLHRPGNRSLRGGLLERLNLAGNSAGDSGYGAMSTSPSLSSTTTSHKTRKPIPLIKKTRFKQLVILGDRSNVLLAVAGRNDHVRVYALDALRMLIRKKMAEIDEKEGWNSILRKRQAAERALAARTLAASIAKSVAPPPVPTAPANLKGKGRVLGPPAPLRLHNSSTSVSTGTDARHNFTDDQDPTKVSPPPAYSFPPPFTRSQPSASSQPSVPRRRSSASAYSGPPTPRYARTRRSSSLQTLTAPFVQRSQSDADHHAGDVSSPAMSPSHSTSAPQSPSSTPLPSLPPTTPSSASIRSVKRRKSKDATNALSGIAVPSRSRRGSLAPSPSSSYIASHASHSISAARRGSAATITPSTVNSLTHRQHHRTSPSSAAQHDAQLSVRRKGSSAFVPEGVEGAPSSSESRRRGIIGVVEYSSPSSSDDSPFASPLASTSTSHAIRAQGENEQETLKDGVGADGDEEGEWIDAPESPTNTTSSAHQYAVRPSPSSSTNVQLQGFRTAPLTTSRAGSAWSSSSRRIRMLPRSPIVQHEVEEEEEEEEREPNEQYIDAGPAEQQEEMAGDTTKTNRVIKSARRISLAQMLNERPPHADQQITEQGSNSSSMSNGVPSASPANIGRLLPREATVTTSNLDALADFLRDGPLDETQSAISVAPTRSVTTTIPASAIPVSPTRSLSQSVHPSNASSISTARPAPRLQPRSPVMYKQTDSETDGPSLIDIMRAGPPSPVPVQVNRSDSTSSEFTTSDEVAGTRRDTLLQRTLSQTQSTGDRRPRKLTKPADLTRQKSLVTVSDALQAANVTPPVSEVPHTVSRPQRSLGLRQRTVSQPQPHSADRSPSLYNIEADGLQHPKRYSLLPRGPTSRDTTAFQSQIPLGPHHRSGDMPRSFSLQEMLVAEPGPTQTPSSSATSPSLARSATATGSENNGRVVSPTAIERVQQTEGRKRWSLLANLRSPQPGSSTASSEQLAGRASSRSASSMSTHSASTSPSLSRMRSHSQNSTNPSSNRGSAAIDPLAVQTDGTSLSALRTTPLLPQAGSTVSPPVLKVRPLPIDDESPPFNNLTPDLTGTVSPESTNPEGATITFTRSANVSTGPGGRHTHVGRAAADNTPLAGALSGSYPAHSSQTNMPLEYVKLARTKGCRFIRASETSKRTYLAVLCGEQGERIELFTGSRNVSLSLNRTFVLPETPRTIEFQLQGEDLLDLYLIYDSAIFALEPSTVRVREVGIQRNERRQARRERDQIAREAVTLHGGRSEAPVRDPIANAATDGDSDARAPESQDEDGAIRRGSRTIPGETAATTSSRLDLPSTTPSHPPSPTIEPANGNILDNETAPIQQNQNGATPSVPTIPYTMFQQLEYLPSVPPSVLGISYINPPTYNAVLSASPAPAQNGFEPPPRPYRQNKASTSLAPSTSSESHTGHDTLHVDDIEMPLLSPVSLLSNPTAKLAGPPGLFFVSKGSKVTNIVDSDGRSVMKKPLEWIDTASPSNAERHVNLDIFTRLEILLTFNRSRVCLVAFGPCCIRALELGGQHHASTEVIPLDAAKRRAKSKANDTAFAGREYEEGYLRDVTYLTKSGEVSFFAERVGNNYAVHALTAAGVLQSIHGV